MQNNNQSIDQIYMQRALELAREAEIAQEVPIGALVVLENKIIGEGFNSPISRNDPTAHAEIIALRNASQTMQNYRLPNATLYVTIEPCTMCVGAMIQARISRLVFGALDPKAGAVFSIFNLLDSKMLNHKIAISSGILQDECAKIIQDFFRERRS